MSASNGRLPPINLAKATQAERDKLLIQLQRQNSLRSPVEASVSTPGNGAYAVLWFGEAPLGTWLVEASMAGNGTTGSAIYQLVAGVRTVGGVSTLVGGGYTTLVAAEDGAAMDARFVLTAGVLYLQVRDDGVQPMDWRAVVSQSR